MPPNSFQTLKPQMAESQNPHCPLPTTGPFSAGARGTGLERVTKHGRSRSGQSWPEEAGKVAPPAVMPATEQSVCTVWLNSHSSLQRHHPLFDSRGLKLCSDPQADRQ